MEKDKRESGPQIEEGHIDIANELVEALAKTQLSGYESRILWALWRMTWGYVEKDGRGRIVYKTNRKGNRQAVKLKFARITSKKWISLTGLKKSSIYKALRRLCKRNIVIKDKNMWGFQKHYKQWVNEGLGVYIDTKIKNKGLGVQNEHSLVSKSLPVGVYLDTKKVTKPLRDKAIPDPKENSLKKTLKEREKEKEKGKNFSTKNGDKKERKKREGKFAKGLTENQIRSANFLKDSIKKFKRGDFK